MSLEIRRLDPATDTALFEQSFGWLAGSPSWRQYTESVFGTLDHTEYMAARLDERRIDIGIFADDVFIAKVALHLVAKSTYEVSLEAMRTADPAIIAQAGQLIRDQLFDVYGAQSVFAWVPRWAKSVQSILTAIGFENSGVIMLRGTCRGRLIEWLRFSLKATDQ